MEEQNNVKTVLTLEPDGKSTSSFFDSVPTMQSVVATQETTEFSAGTIDESMLSDEEKETVDQFVKEIDVTNVDQMVKYGSSAQRNISDFSASVLKKVKTYELGDIGNSLKELTIALDASTESEKKGLMGLFQKAKRGVNSIRANYSKAETNVNRIEKDLKKHSSVLTSDISMYQRMYELNVQYYKELTMYIIAGKKAVSLARATRLAELKQIADSTGKQEDAQAYRDYEDLCHRFEKKIADLEITRVICIQSAPQVRMLQNNDREMLDKIQSSLSNTIPLWRNQLVISLGIEHTRKAVEAQSALTDKTNELLAQNAEMLKTATIETAKESERPIADVETLRKVNRDLITSINEVVKIHEQGAANRVKIREELVRIEDDLKQAMIEASNT